ncbi:flavin-containing monooxygenase [Oceanobacillus rekensis]|uniref:flavin-containing monooxygenase n=1 Tax=Oceanobacillus rekensis TaxID=937927 RepID=UPI000B435B55|nr:NAD(P)/FAD-dependent oxidoreductase [Oceanobacillus rekensis]
MSENNRVNVGLDFDAVVIGAGFGGLYAVHKLQNELGLSVCGYEKGGDVGGTWYWNRYPGALSDSESFVYRYSFDKELLQEWTWESNYLTQKEVLNYLTHVAERYDLYRSYQFNREIKAAQYNEEGDYWEVTTDKGDTVTAKYLVTGLGLLSSTNKPMFKGNEIFQGEQYHTGAWPDGVSLEGKRVGVIGTGSTGIQLITAIAPQCGHLTVFQRTPQYSVPLGKRPQSEEEINEIKANYDKIWDQVKNSATAFGYEESDVPAFSVSEEERERIFEEYWNKGNGFRFMFGTFGDIATDTEANEAAASFIRKKINQIVKDKETAEKLTPQELYARRPAADNGYYETFNRGNVSLVDVKQNPIQELTPKGVKTTDGEYDLDVLIYATGFDAVEGNYVKMDLRGRNGVAIQDKWEDGPTGYLGIMNTDFPNMFMILGPNGPFTNLVPTIGTQVEWISDMVKQMVENNLNTVEPTADAESEWLETCRTIADATVFSSAQSWIFGANVPGKKSAVRFYMGGLGNFRKFLEESSIEGLVFNKERNKVTQE